MLKRLIKRYKITPNDSAEDIIPSTFKKGKVMIKRTVYPDGEPKMSKYEPNVQWYGN